MELSCGDKILSSTFGLLRTTRNGERLAVYKALTKKGVVLRRPKVELRISSPNREFS
jgi:hypothetical protein